MSPENASVFLVEDSPDALKHARNTIQEADHSIIAEATTLEEAFTAINTDSIKGVQVAVIDANLRKRDYSGSDGKDVAEALRRKYPDVKIISYSGLTQSYGDVHIDKNEYDESITLGDVITKL